MRGSIGRRSSRRKDVADYTRPDKALERLGIKPEEVTDVVVTHMHWDHADGVDLFPKAQVWIQKDEYDHYTPARPGRPRRNDDGTRPGHYQALMKLNSQGRVHLVDGDAKEIVPGVTVYTGGKHTFASQYVGVNTKAGRDGDRVGQPLSVREPRQARPDRADRRREVEPGGAGPDEAACVEPAADHPGPRPGGVRPVPEAGEWRGSGRVGLAREPWCAQSLPSREAFSVEEHDFAAARRSQPKWVVSRQR